MDKESNPLERSLLILGAGGLALEIYEIVQQSGKWQAVAFLDDGANNLHNLNVTGTISSLKQWRGQFSHAIAAVGNCVVRMEWLNNASEAGFEIPSIFHPSAVISPSAKIGAGCIIMSNTSIGAKAQLGNGILVNHGAHVDHECVIENGALLGLGCVIRNGVRIKELQHVRPLTLME